MKSKVLIALAMLSIAGCSSMTPTKTTEQAYMVIDVQGDSSIRDDLLDTVIETAQSSMDSLTVNRGIPPSNIPETASRFELVDPFANSQFSGVMSGLSAYTQAHGGASMKTSKLTGAFKDDAATRNEYYEFAKGY